MRYFKKLRTSQISSQSVGRKPHPLERDARHARPEDLQAETFYKHVRSKEPWNLSNVLYLRKL